MKKLHLYAVMSVALSMSTAIAFAGDKDKDGGKGGPGNPGRPISWEELKDRCLNPLKHDVQRAPENIRIQCTDQRKNWTAAAPGEIPLAGHRTVVTGVFADKFFVNQSQVEVPVAVKPGTCHNFVEVLETITIERPLSCAEVIGIKSDLAEYCVNALDSAKGSNPKLVDVTPTGETRSTCGVGGDQGKPGTKKP